MNEDFERKLRFFNNLSKMLLDTLIRAGYLFVFEAEKIVDFIEPQYTTSERYRTYKKNRNMIMNYELNKDRDFRV
jgi:hypothetical protein